MALDKAGLRSGIKKLMDDMSKAEKPDHAQFATKMSDLIDAFVKSGTVTVQQGIAVTTSGSATAQTGLTTSTGTGTIS